MEWLSRFFGLFGLPFSFLQNDRNAKAIMDTNATNLQIARETNKSNVEQANLAYQRSLPINQVNNLVGAGMSKSAALNSLSGGGTYTAPVMQGASVQAPHYDYSQIASVIERLGNLPANVAQAQIQQEQLRGLQIDNDNKIAAENRANDLHQYQVWKEQYGKESATKLDSAKNLIMSALLDSNKDINEFSSFKDLISSLGLKDHKDLQGLPALAWNQLENDIRNSFADARAEREQKNKDTAAYDAHQLSLMEQAFKKIDYKYYDKEKHEQLLNLMRVGQGLIEDNNIKFQDRSAKEMENFVREAGIDNERDARALQQYVNKLLQSDALVVADKAANYPSVMKNFRAALRLFLGDLGEVLSKVKL